MKAMFVSNPGGQRPEVSRRPQSSLVRGTGSRTIAFPGAPAQARWRGVNSASRTETSQPQCDFRPRVGHYGAIDTTFLRLSSDTSTRIQYRDFDSQMG